MKVKDNNIHQKFNRDFIFIIGASGVGKTTLAKKLYEHLKSVYIEQFMIPEFITLDGNVEVNGKLEEKTLFTSMIALLRNFNKLGFKNIIALDFNDLRSRDLPQIFKGKNFITLKLISSDLEQNIRQMINRGEGLKNVEELKYAHKKIVGRELLPNEFLIDVKGKSENQVFSEAIRLIETVKVKTKYEYKKLPKTKFVSWVRDDKLNYDTDKSIVESNSNTLKTI